MAGACSRWSGGAGATKRTVSFNDPSSGEDVTFGFTAFAPGLSWSENDVVPIKLVRGPNPATPATGSPAITGTPNLGQVLTAGAGTIADLNSLPVGPFPTGYTIQWIRVDGTTDTEITGATASTYRLVAADVGKKVKVKVSFTDGGGAAEERTSGAFPSGTISGSSTAVIASLELSHGTLSPPLSSATEGYNFHEVLVPDWLSEITITAVAGDPNSSLHTGEPQVNTTGEGTSAVTVQRRLTHGPNHFTFAVRTRIPNTDNFHGRYHFVNVLRGSRLAYNGEVTVGERGVYRFERADFNFSRHRDDFRAVYITSLPAEGKGWVQVNNRILEPRHLPGGMRIQGVDLGLVRYIAPEDGHGDDFATFTFEVSTNGGLRSVANYTMTVNVTPGPPRILPYMPAADSFVSNMVAQGYATTGQLKDFDMAQGFRTGAHADGYVLHEVAIRLSTRSGTTVPAIHIAKGDPGATTGLIPLEAPTLEPNRKAYPVVYTAPANATLEADTDYYVVIKGGIKDHCCYPYFDSTQGTGHMVAEPGWSMHRGYRVRQLRLWVGGDRTIPYAWPWRPAVTSTLMIEIRGTEAASGSVEADPPAVVGTPVVSGEGNDGTWSEGETVRVALTFSESVVVETRTGTPTLGIDLGLGGTSARSAAYESGSGATTLTFAYTLTADDGSHTHMAVTQDSLTLGGGTIRSIATGFDALLSHVGTVVLGTSSGGGGSQGSSRDDEEPTQEEDATPPLLSSAYVYFANMTLTFDEALDATSIPATSAFSVNVDGSPLDVSGVSVSGNTVRLGLAWWTEAGQTVTLGYTAPTGQSDGKLRDAAGNAVASFSGQAVSNHTEPTGGDEPTEGEQSEAGSGGDTSGSDESTPGDTTAPLVSSAAVNGAALTLTFDEALDADALPAASAFTVTAAGAGRAVQTVTASDSSVTLTLAAAVVAGEAVTVDYTAPADEPAARLRDLAGNAVASFTGQSVTNSTAALLTASAHDVPAHHDGSEKFSFELRFSETPEDDFSYKTLRDHAFTATGGEVVKANRLAHGKNVRWQIHVTPDGNGAATIVLPPTTDCEATGAVCTQDGRKLSGRLEVRVPRQNRAATGAPTITGTAQVGETLTARTSGISDVDGLNGDTVAYQWIASDGATDTEISGATGFSYTLVEADVGKAIKVRVSFTDLAGNEESLTSAATAAVAAAAPVVIPEDEEEEETTPLTAGAHDVPGSHDGSTTFTFELRFSEQIPVSYITLRDHALTVTGGDVVNARRLAPGENIRWEISVTPDGNGAVTIVLPPTTDCEATGAICARDGRMLSNRLQISVPGPGG